MADWLVHLFKLDNALKRKEFASLKNNKTNFRIMQIFRYILLQEPFITFLSGLMGK